MTKDIKAIIEGAQCPSCGEHEELTPNGVCKHCPQNGD